MSDFPVLDFFSSVSSSVIGMNNILLHLKLGQYWQGNWLIIVALMFTPAKVIWIFDRQLSFICFVYICLIYLVS